MQPEEWVRAKSLLRTGASYSASEWCWWWHGVPVVVGKQYQDRGNSRILESNIHECTQQKALHSEYYNLNLKACIQTSKASLKASFPNIICLQEKANNNLLSSHTVYQTCHLFMWTNTADASKCNFHEIGFTFHRLCQWGPASLTCFTPLWYLQYLRDNCQRPACRYLQQQTKTFSLWYNHPNPTLPGGTTLNSPDMCWVDSLNWSSSPA